MRKKFLGLVQVIGSARALMVGIGLSLCFVSLYGQAQVEWQHFEAKEDSFSVMIPIAFERHSKTIPTVTGNMETVNYTANIKEGHPNFVYAIHIIKYQEGQIHSDSTDMKQALIDETVRLIALKNGCKIQYLVDDLVAGEPGFLFRMRDDQTKMVIKGKIVWRHHTLYVINVFTMHDVSLNNYMDRYFDTFQFKT